MSRGMRYGNVRNHHNSTSIGHWQHHAVCRNEPPELFFPVGTSGPAIQQVEQAKSVCRRCPVSNECLRWALDTGQDSGVWGGLSEDERRDVNRRTGERFAR